MKFNLAWLVMNLIDFKILNNKIINIKEDMGIVLLIFKMDIYKGF